MNYILKTDEFYKNIITIEDLKTNIELTQEELILYNVFELEIYKALQQKTPSYYPIKNYNYIRMGIYVPYNLNDIHVRIHNVGWFNTEYANTFRKLYHNFINVGFKCEIDEHCSMLKIFHMSLAAKIKMIQALETQKEYEKQKEETKRKEEEMKRKEEETKRKEDQTKEKIQELEEFFKLYNIDFNKYFHVYYVNIISFENKNPNTFNVLYNLFIKNIDLIATKKIDIFVISPHFYNKGLILYNDIIVKYGQIRKWYENNNMVMGYDIINLRIECPDTHKLIYDLFVNDVIKSLKKVLEESDKYKLPIIYKMCLNDYFNVHKQNDVF